MAARGRIKRVESLQKMWSKSQVAAQADSHLAPEWEMRIRVILVQAQKGMLPLQSSRLGHLRGIFLIPSHLAIVSTPICLFHPPTIAVYISITAFGTLFAVFRFILGS